MGVFDNFFNANKPGKGISKEQVLKEREKVTIDGFFKVFKRKFWQLIQLNLLSILFFIPLLLLGIDILSQFILPGKQLPLVSAGTSDIAYTALWSNVNAATSNAAAQAIGTTELFIRINISIFLTAIPMIAIGPIQAGFTYILQSFIKEKPVFLVHDFFSRAKSNFWQSLVVSVINIIVTGMFLWGLYFYSQQVSLSGNLIWTIALMFMLVIFLVFMIMNLYIYPVLVTFNVNFRQLYKNSFLLGMTSFFPAVIVILLNAAILVIVSMFITNPIYQLVVMAVITYALLGLINNYFSYKYIKFHLLDPALAAAEEKNKAAEEE